jgi:hypothetical protein
MDFLAEIDSYSSVEYGYLGWERKFRWYNLEPSLVTSLLYDK